MINIHSKPHRESHTTNQDLKSLISELHVLFLVASID